MKGSLSVLISFAILFTLAMSAPLARGHRVLHRLSPHLGVSRRVQATLPAKRPLNLTFTHMHSGDVPVHVEYGTSTRLQATDFSFSATLFKLSRDDDRAEVGRPSSGDAQAVVHLASTYGGRHVIISAPGPVVQTFKQRGVRQGDIPEYVRRNVEVSDPDTGDRYQLVPNSIQEERATVNPSAIMIALNAD